MMGPRRGHASPLLCSSHPLAPCAVRGSGSHGRWRRPWPVWALRLLSVGLNVQLVQQLQDGEQVAADDLDGGQRADAEDIGGGQQVDAIFFPELLHALTQLVRDRLLL